MPAALHWLGHLLGDPVEVRCRQDVFVLRLRSGPAAEVDDVEVVGGQVQRRRRPHVAVNVDGRGDHPRHLDRWAERVGDVAEGLPPWPSSAAEEDERLRVEGWEVHVGQLRPANGRGWQTKPAEGRLHLLAPDGPEGVVALRRPARLVPRARRTQGDVLQPRHVLLSADHDQFALDLHPLHLHLRHERELRALAPLSGSAGPRASRRAQGTSGSPLLSGHGAEGHHELCAQLRGIVLKQLALPGEDLAQTQQEVASVPQGQQRLLLREAARQLAEVGFGVVLPLQPPVPVGG